MAACCLSERFERRVHTARAFGIESIRHHRITPDEASSGEPVTEVVREFLHWLGGRRLLGYNLGFDLDMLSPHVRALAGFELPNPTEDLADEVAARATPPAPGCTDQPRPGTHRQPPRRADDRPSYRVGRCDDGGAVLDRVAGAWVAGGLIRFR